MWQADICIYHSPCDDGFAAALAVKLRWPDVEFVPGTYGKPAPDVSGKRVLIVDFSFKRDVLAAMGDVAAGIVILDHHKTAEADLAEWSGWTVEALGGFDGPAVALAKQCTETGRPIAAAFDMEKSGARLAWEFCHPGQPPLELIRYVEDRDLWRYALPDTRAFSLYLRSKPMDFDEWMAVAGLMQGDFGRYEILTKARAVEEFYDRKLAELVREARFIIIDGHHVPAVNCSWAFASDVAHQLLDLHPTAPFAACYYDRGDGRRSFSLRSLDDRADVSAVAARLGGGGHRNAAGFERGAPIVSIEGLN